jgi:hypothetical protein
MPSYFTLFEKIQDPQLDLIYEQFVLADCALCGLPHCVSPHAKLSLLNSPSLSSLSAR